VGSNNSVFLATICLLLFKGGTFACEITDKFSVGGVLAGAWQYLEVNENDVDEGAKASAAFQPEISFRPFDNSELFAKFGFAANNGLNVKSPFALAIWAADLEDDLKDINGRNRDYILTSWAKHTFKFCESHSLGLSFGIIDATDYVDQNAFANDEYSQFLNEVFDNAPTGNFVSYDIGGAAQWTWGNFSASGLIMDVGENEEGNNFQFTALQLAYRLETSLGEGNYRIIGSMTSDDFSNAAGEGKNEKLAAVTLSFDQQFGETIGAFLRLGYQEDEAVINWRKLYSGGFNINGGIWGRAQDNIGMGLAYLHDGNSEIDHSLVGEAYVRFALTEMLAATADFQYLRDDIRGDQNPDGWVGSIRATVEF
jgi:porin